jgi:hypothetical protein
VACGLYLHSTLGQVALSERMTQRLGLNVQLASARPIDLQVWEVSGFAEQVDGADPGVTARLGRWDESGAEARLDLQGTILLLGDEVDLQQKLGKATRTLRQGARLLLDDLELRGAWAGWNLSLSEASAVLLLGPGSWRATLQAARLNGHALSQPLRAQIEDPAGFGGDQSSQIQFPETPLSWLELRSPCGGGISGGSVRGVCRQEPDGAWACKARLSNLDLQEWSCALAPARLDGRIADAAVEAAWHRARGVEKLQCSAVLADLSGAQVAAALGLPETGGCLQVEIVRADIRQGRAAELLLRGRWSDVEMAPLAELLGDGQAEGRLEVSATELHLSDGVVTRADLEIRYDSQSHGPAWIEARLLRSVGEAWLGSGCPPLPDAELEISQASFRLIVEGPHLTILPAAVPGAPILSVRLLGREVPVFAVPEAGLVLDDCWTAASRAARLHQNP